jgi:monofunctional glycosyltransferase
LPNPRKLNPVGNSRYVAKRAAVIHRIMVKRGIVIPEYEEILKDKTESPGEQAKDPESPSPEVKMISPSPSAPPEEPVPPVDSGK